MRMGVGLYADDDEVVVVVMGSVNNGGGVELSRGLHGGVVR